MKSSSTSHSYQGVLDFKAKHTFEYCTLTKHFFVTEIYMYISYSLEENKVIELLTKNIKKT